MRVTENIFQKMITAEKWFPFLSAFSPLPFLLFLFWKIQRRKLAEEKLRIGFFENHFSVFHFWKLIWRIRNLDFWFLKMLDQENRFLWSRIFFVECGIPKLNFQKVWTQKNGSLFLLLFFRFSFFLIFIFKKFREENERRKIKPQNFWNWFLWFAILKNWSGGSGSSNFENWKCYNGNLKIEFLEIGSGRLNVREAEMAD